MTKKNVSVSEDIFIAGAGGQGILLLGKIIAQSAVEEDKFVTYYPTYGAEIRGGTANCSVRISDAEINSPVVTRPTTFIIMNQQSLTKFIGKVQKDSYLILNSLGTEVIKEVPANHCISIPASEIAQKLGDVRCANIVMLGAYVKLKKIISPESAVGAIKKAFENKPELIELNLKAFREVK
ncbi:MAG: hypothetical protein AUJ85_00365 [Elusimicrobia bacterium CG1_02_37_114]|nr:MAG: hypothetical protein AUJ85_00365 [Elusimicrobia bacterium CG1_02_37_114]PIV53153.1 MAG: 2-oxoacid:ferredoxin oxidoreductase subunit gamma [Elusimicrobia bacterium CG02_land_8_20_14_3_00_37_13]PIZ13900.1 MAG: 2-oxoacid:ferredoxin oxidoreductase subunit gamma [Elusimicrobia bacterium CG_4_10_14_0_8_um_filter_37_32]